jgi:hypothetical protein
MKYESQSWDANISSAEKSFRSFISNDPALIYFLETGTLRKNAKFAKEEIYKDPAFLAFISPYFETVYADAVIQCFQTKNTNLISDIAMNPVLLTDAYRQHAVSKILAYLEEKKKRLVSLTNQAQLGGAFPVVEAEDYIGIMVISVLNYLPMEFQSFRTAYATEIIKMARGQLGHDLQRALTIMDNVRQLKCDSHVAADANALYKQLDEANTKIQVAANAAADSGSSGGNIWVIISVILVILRIILYVARH